MTKPTKAAGSKSSKDSGAKGSKAIADVAHPGTSAPSDTSKSIITHRPMMKDPMVVEDGEKQPEDKAGLTPGKLAGETTITPLSGQKDDEPDTPSPDAAADTPDADAKADGKTGGAADDKPDDKSDAKPGKADSIGKSAPPKADKTGEAEEAASAADTDAPAGAETDEKPGTETGKGQDKPADDAKAAAQAENDAKTAKLIESKQYFLPINAVEHRRSTQIAVAGAILALILAMAWVDVALDAGLIHLGGVKPVTHIFSN
jgi:hypothetical protein